MATELERAQERHLFVFVGHAAALGAQDQQTGQLTRRSPSAAAASPPSAIMASVAGSLRSVERQRVREPDAWRSAAAERPADCRQRSDVSSGAGRGWPPAERPGPARLPGRGHPIPAAGPRPPPRAAGGPASARSTRLPTASRIFCIARSNLYFSRKNWRSITR